MQMKFSVGIPVCALLCTTALSNAHAESKTDDYLFSLTGNVGVHSDYVFRGNSLTDNGSTPAVSGGLDFNHKDTNWYGGVWTSNSSELTEVNVYTGVGVIDQDYALDFGVIAYLFPQQADAGSNTDRVEAFVGVQFPYVEIYNWYQPDDRQLYSEINLNFPLTSKLAIGLHLGRNTDLENDASNPVEEQTDATLSLSYDGWSLKLTATDDSDKNPRLYVNKVWRHDLLEDIADAL